MNKSVDGCVTGTPTREGDYPILIRQMREDDIPTVARLCGQWGYPASLEQVLPRFLQLAADPNRCLYVAQADDGQVVGWVDVHAYHTLAADSTAEIGGIVVDQSCRRQGVGRALMAQAEAWAQSRGYSSVRLRSNAARSEAHQFYPGLGYQLVKTQHVYAKKLTQY